MAVLFCVCNSALKQEQGYRALLPEITPLLRGLLSLHCYGDVVASVPFLTIDVRGLRGEALKAAHVELQAFMEQVVPGVVWTAGETGVCATRDSVCAGERLRAVTARYHVLGLLVTRACVIDRESRTRPVSVFSCRSHGCWSRRRLDRTSRCWRLVLPRTACTRSA